MAKDIVLRISSRNFFLLGLVLIAFVLVVGVFAYPVSPGAVPDPVGHSLTTIQGYFQGDASLLDTLGKLQQRGSSGMGCPAGEYIREVGQDGSVTCEADQTAVASSNLPTPGAVVSGPISGGGVKNYVHNFGTTDYLVYSDNCRPGKEILDYTKYANHLYVTNDSSWDNCTFYFWQWG